MMTFHRSSINPLVSKLQPNSRLGKFPVEAYVVQCTVHMAPSHCTGNEAYRSRGLGIRPRDEVWEWRPGNLQPREEASTPMPHSQASTLHLIPDLQASTLSLIPRPSFYASFPGLHPTFVACRLAGQMLRLEASGIMLQLYGITSS